MLEDVIYSYLDHLLFVLLKTNYVLVCDTHFNPCLTREIWVPSERSNKINTLTMVHRIRDICFKSIIPPPLPLPPSPPPPSLPPSLPPSQCNVALPGGKPHSLIFGGQFDGNIVLLHSTHSIYSMPFPCPAHDSRVTMLFGATDDVTSIYTNGEGEVVAQCALVSYGRASDRLHFWGVKLIEESLTLSLHLLRVVKMTSYPRLISLMASTACLALDDHQIVMIRTQPDNRRKSLTPDIVCMNHPQVLEHQDEEDHTHTITSLNACPYLKVFVSSGKDGLIKVWNFDSQLVTELSFGVALSSVGFANSQGDLLVGLDLQISQVKAKDYLPEPYLQMSRCCTLWDYKEKPVGFDPHLEFW